MQRPETLEEKTVRIMIGLYCASHHGTQNGQLCEQCLGLLNYSRERVSKCPFGSKKPVCAACTIHCYQKERRADIRRVMRFAGPRMLYCSPLLTIRYLFRKFFRSRGF